MKNYVLFTFNYLFYLIPNFGNLIIIMKSKIARVMKGTDNTYEAPV